MGSVFGMHDRDNIEVISFRFTPLPPFFTCKVIYIDSLTEQQVFCYALSQNDGTEWRQRIQSEAEHFVDVSAMTSDMIARLINQDKIQILINLNGYTKVINNAVLQ